MKGLSPLKLRIIITLQLVAIALLAGLFIARPWDKAGAAAGKIDTPPPHNRIRAAEISLNPALSWELTLAGTKSEQAVASFIHNGYLYVFGNTASSDLDFDRSGIFLAVIDVYGVTKGFFVYGGEGELLRFVCLGEGAFLLAVEAPSSPKLYAIDFSGNQTKVISGFLSSFESVYEVKYYYGGYLLLSGLANNLTDVKSLRCSFFSSSLQFSGSRLAVSPYSLAPFETVLIGSRVAVVCDASSSMHTLPAIVEFSQNESPKITAFSQYAGAVRGLSIYQGEFLLLTAMEGSSLLQIGLDYVVKSRVFLSQLSAISLSEVGPDTPAQLYLAFVDTAVYIIDGKGQRKNTLPAFVPNGNLNGRAYTAGGLVVYAGAGGVRAYSHEKTVFAAGIAGGGADSMITVDENNMFYIYHADGDVKITKLRTLL